MREVEITSPVSRPLSREEAESRLGPGAVLVGRSLDARGAEPLYRYRLEVYGPQEHYEPYRLQPLLDVRGGEPVIVVGAGPAGLFAALKLICLGLRPIVLERGRDVHSRKRDVALLSTQGVVDSDSNYCFGEGGAGAFSDGKLHTRSSKRGDNREVLFRLVEFGASPDIVWDAHPHIGSDRLPQIVENVRLAVTDHGGEYRFGARVCGLRRLPSGLMEARCADGSAFEGRAVILATGHSARDVYDMMQDAGVPLEAKGFALGVRAEHPQQLIDRARFRCGRQEGMPAAEYSFVRQVDGRGVFSFCMCPGGILVPSSTEQGSVVLNGMSNSARNSRWANAGVVVQIEPGDEPPQYRSHGAFSLLDFQRDVERAMFIPAGPHPLAAPAQRLQDFCSGRISRTLPETSYHPGAVSADLRRLLPPCVAGRLAKALPAVPLRGYCTGEALLLGVESRTSSPVRIPRDPSTLECLSFPGVFPCGEGAGYSGGIVSSAIDGIRAAECCARVCKL